ncbi:MAG: acyl-CoA dehydrogenase family protein [Myxococcota bacterium]
MNFGFSEEQDHLRREARKWIDERCPVSEVRRLAETPLGHSPELWKQLGELGWLGLTVAEEHGGSGLEWEDLVVLLEETGRTLFPSPLLSSTLAARAVSRWGTGAQQERWLPSLANGSSIGTVALFDESDRLTPEAIQTQAIRRGDDVLLRGDKTHVPDAGAADLLVIAYRSDTNPRDIGLALIETAAAGLEISARPSLDATHRLADVQLQEVVLPPENQLAVPGDGWTAIRDLIDCGALGVAAEAIGVAEGALALTVQYAKDRVQFGSPIGHFQGVKHPLAEMYMDIESLKSLVYYAAWTVRARPDETPLAAAQAKAFAAETLTRIGVGSIQLHGAIGYTLEHDIQLYLKRSKWVRPMYGDENHHYERICAMGSS